MNNNDKNKNQGVLQTCRDTMPRGDSALIGQQGQAKGFMKNFTSCQSFGSTSSARWSPASSCEAWRRSGKQSCNPPPPWAPGCWWRTCREETTRGRYCSSHFTAASVLQGQKIVSRSSPAEIKTNKNSKGSRVGVVAGGLVRLHSQEEVFHHVVVIVAVAVWQEAGCKHDDGVVLRVVTWERAQSVTVQSANTCHWTLWELLVRTLQVCISGKDEILNTEMVKPDSEWKSYFGLFYRTLWHWNMHVFCLVFCTLKYHIFCAIRRN